MALENLFPSIGTLAQQQADSQADVNQDNGRAGTPPKEDDDRVVQEIESLCMNCEEQVGINLPPL
jgi:zinc finger protein